MKKVVVILCFLLSFFPRIVWGQGQCLPGGCAAGGFSNPGGILSTVSSSFTVVSTTLFGGDFSLYNVTAGSTYEWSMCPADGGSCSFNAQLTLYSNLSPVFPLCFSDDFCGDDPKIQWTATFTGVVRVKVSAFNCVTNTIFSTLVWRCASCGPIPATCVDNDDCLTPQVIPFTPGTPACIIDCTNGSLPGINFPGNNCQDFPNPTVWYQITTGPVATSMNIGLTSADLLAPYFSVFTTSNCTQFTTVNCTQGVSGSVSATVGLAANTTYIIAVSNNAVATGYFNMCVIVNDDNSACNTSNSLTVTATSAGSPLSGPFVQGEVVTFCYNISDYQQNNCNYLQGIVPIFGNGWSPASFNGLGMPNNITVPLTTSGTVQLIAGVNNACTGTSAGTWNWFSSGSVTYNLIPNGQLIPNTNLPAGWFFLNSFDPTTGACAPDPVDPDFSLGDGNFNACLPNNLDWQVCFQLIAGGPTQCTNQKINCSVTMRTFADGEIGAWTNNSCVTDGSGAETFSATVCCTAPPTPVTPLVYCQNASSVALSAAGTNLLWYTNATGGVGNPVAPVPSTAVTGTFQYYVSQNNGLCESSRALITVIVNAPNVATINYASPFCANTVGSQPVTRIGTAGGSYSSTAGLTINSVTGAITPSTSLPGTYIVTYTLPASGGCPAYTVTENVVINSLPLLPTLTPSNPCAGSTVNFTAGGGSFYEFLLNGISQGPASAINTLNIGPLAAGGQICVKSYPALPINFNGLIVEPEWGSPLANSTGGPATSGFGPGNNLDALYLKSGSGYLYGAIAGNVVDNSNNRILLFIDCQPGGFNNLGAWVNRTNAPYWSVENLSSAITFDVGFTPEYVLAMNQATANSYFDLYNMVSNTNIFLGDGNASPTLGFSGNTGVGDFTKGFEFAIPMGLLGNPTVAVKVFAMLVNDPGFGNPTNLSNQFLTRANPLELNYGNAAVNFDAAAPNPILFPLSTDCFSQTCVTVASPVTPTFNVIVPICAGTTPPLLPTISNNGISGTWSPAVVSNASSGSYTFTPNLGQCATPVTINVTVDSNPLISPIYHD